LGLMGYEMLRYAQHDKGSTFPLDAEMLRSAEHRTLLSHSGKHETLVRYNIPIFEAFHVQKGFLYCKIDTGEVYSYKVFF
jgi:hypothetical protein